MYTKKTLQHFRNPRNYGKIKNPSAIGRVGNIMCGDLMVLYLKIVKNKIQKIKFETFGCAAAIATSSMITEIAKGKTLEQALQINKDDIIKSLGGLPQIKTHCSILAIDALSEAIYQYFTKNKQFIPQVLKDRHLRIKREKALIKEKFQ